MHVCIVCANQIHQEFDQGDNSEFSFNTAVRGFHVDHRVWLPYSEQPLGVENEQGIAENQSRDHSKTGVVKNLQLDTYHQSLFVASILSIFQIRSIYTQTSH